MFRIVIFLNFKQFVFLHNINVASTTPKVLSTEPTLCVHRKHVFQTEMTEETFFTD